MEIYKDSSERTVYFELPIISDKQTIEVTLVQNGEVLYTFDSATYADGKYSVLIPFRFVAYDGDYEVNWSIEYFEDEDESTQWLMRTTYFSVVTPYVPLSVIKDIIESDDDEEAAKVESAVRHIINNYCSQSFGYSHKTLTVPGRGDQAIRLPERLVSIEGLSTLTANLDINGTIITGNGFYLKKGWVDEVSSISTTNTYFGDGVDITNALPGEPGYEKPGHGYIIKAPESSGTATTWQTDYPFAITGWWGYKSVPANVTSAALLLVNDYACQEIAYRDRYLTSFKASDFRFDISPVAWTGTGNVRADQLLDEFVLLNWAVL